MNNLKNVKYPGIAFLFFLLSIVSPNAEPGADAGPERWYAVERWVGTVDLELEKEVEKSSKQDAYLYHFKENVRLSGHLRLERNPEIRGQWEGTVEGMLSGEANTFSRAEKHWQKLNAYGSGRVEGRALLRIWPDRGCYQLTVSSTAIQVPGTMKGELYARELLGGGRYKDHLTHTLNESFSHKISAGGRLDPRPPLPATGWRLSGSQTQSKLGEFLVHRVLWSLMPEGAYDVHVQGPAETIEGLDSEPFTAVVFPPDANVESYAWEASWPEGAGHRPEVIFEDPNAESTHVLQARWFALPDSRWVADTCIECVYEIVAIARIDGVDYRSDPHPWTVRVEAQGEALPFPVWGQEWTLEIERSEEDGLWYVTGPGNFQRYAMWAHIDTPESSDFYDKVEAHEEHHVRQHHGIEPWASMWDVGTFYRTVLVNLPGQPSRSDMFWLAMDEVDAWDARETEWYLLHQCLMEWEAFQVEYGVEPRYLEWRKEDVEEAYGCEF